MNDVLNFAWFTAWVNQHLSLGLTFVRAKTWRELVEGLGLPGVPVGRLTFEDAFSEETPLMRVGEIEGWAYAVEDMPTLGIRTDLLAGLSRDRGEGFALSYTPTINTFMYAADGELVNG